MKSDMSEFEDENHEKVNNYIENYIREEDEY
jgi:hypothetical protein